MQLTNISISALAYDNRPFTRVLTATLMNQVGTATVQATGSNIIAWNFPFNRGVYAFTPNGSAYRNNIQAPVSTIGTMYFYFSATPYDYKTTNYTLCTLNFRCSRFTVDTQTAIYKQSFDTFPAIDFDIFINYQNTKTDTLFYRTTSTTPFPANIRLNSTSHPFTAVNSISSNTHLAWFTLNNSSTKNYLISGNYNFIRNVPRLSSVQATLTALSAPGTKFSWYGPHLIEKELKVSFVPPFLTAGTFVAWPSSYFPDPTTLAFISAGEHETLSPGVCFYGEGHTENIHLSARNIGNYNYNWFIDNSRSKYTVINPTSSTTYAKITSTQGYYPVLPISLLITDTNSTYISVTSPTYYYDDTTGAKTYYPYYTSTIDPSGNEDQNNTKLKQSIRVGPYNFDITSQFLPGVNLATYIPINGDPQNFTARANILFYVPTPCYEKHNAVWSWFAFTENQLSAGTTTPDPSSWDKPTTWGTVECSAGYPKKWAFEPPQTIVVSPIVYSVSTTEWFLSAFTPEKSWSDFPLQTHTGIGPEQTQFTYTLQTSGYGGDLKETPGFTVSRFSNTNCTIAASQTVYTTITATYPGLTSNDWTYKKNNVYNTFDFTVIEPFKLYIYPPNKYVEINKPTFFENLFIKTVNAVTAVEVVFDEDDPNSDVLYLTGDQIDQNFTVTYTSPGAKSLKITGLSPFYIGEYPTVYKDLIRVLETYDVVEPDAYYNFDRILVDLPWKSQPTIGANDWVVSDNINACIKMFNDNLDFLNTRSNVYSNTYNEYYGWLGTEPTVMERTSECLVFTWDDLDCTNPDNTATAYTAWSDFMSGGFVYFADGRSERITETGSFARCAKWEQHICPLSSVIPNCLSKYCLEWRWASRKSENSNAIVTWKDTKLSAVYEKEWVTGLDECETVSNLNCDEGVWNVNIPETTFNTWYDPIPVCFSQNKCSYTCIASYNNIIYAGYSTQLKLLSSNRTATFFDLRTTFNQASPFANIKSIALDSEQKIFILDSDLSQVTVYKYKPSSPGERWALFTTFGGVGGSLSKTKFLNPTNIHVDQFDNVWVVDSGNCVLKRYTNTGSWLYTLRDDGYLKTDPPIDVCVDSSSNVHVMTVKVVRVYSYQGEFLYQYSPGEDILPLKNLRKIAASYNREMIYIATKTQVIRHFRTGEYSGTIINNKQCVDNINDLFHDEYRNLLVANDNKILKFVDTMTLIQLKAPLPHYYWSLNDLLVHEEEYVQNWVYTKAFHRLWDNIEIFRNTLLYENTGTCKKYKPPIHDKDKITIGQNEIVTSTVINRVLGYLWDNFNSMLEYYDPNC